MFEGRCAFAIVGATGFTGRAMVSYLQQRLSKPLTWIIAGRDVDSLNKMAAGFAPAVAPVVVEILDLGQSDLSKVTGQTRWLINVAGPYASHGERVIESCLETGTHYLDISGEVDVIADWIERFHSRAKSKNIQVIPASGFESLPFDLMTQAVVKRSQSLHINRQVHVDVLLSYYGLGWASFPQHASSGTLTTAWETLRRNPAKSTLLNPLSLTDATATEISDSKSSLCLDAYYDAEYAIWRTPLLPGPFINPAMIHRSNALLSHSGQGYGQGFSYHESMNVSSIAPWPVGQSVLAHTLASGTREFLAALGEDSVRRKSALALWQGLASQPSKISAKDLDGVNYQLDVVANRGTEHQIKSRLYGRGHPGYRSTANMVAEIILGISDSPTEGGVSGVITPAVAFGAEWLPRLNQAGIEHHWL